MPKPFLTTEWRNLLMANYEIDPKVLQPYLPCQTELDSFNNSYYVSLVGFLFANTRLWDFSFPFHKTFEEVNLRFYVRYKEEGKWKRGVVFLKEIVPKHMISFIANTIYGENYRTHLMDHSFKQQDEFLCVDYQWKVGNEWNFLKSKANAIPQTLAEGSEEEFITEHYWGYTFINQSCSGAYEVQHPKWRIHPVADYQINCSTEKLYGPAFVEVLSGKPKSVFLAEGSSIAVMKRSKNLCFNIFVTNSIKLENYTLLIIGGGPIGLACALEAKQKGIDYVVIEKGTLANSLYNYPVNMTFFSTSERLEIGGVPFVTNLPKPKRAEALEYYRRVAQDNKVNIHLFEEALEIKKNEVFSVTTTKTTYTAKNIIIATGFYDIPYLLNVPGEDLPKVKHYYDDPHYYAFQKVLIVGAQNSAVDAALETWRKGADVTMVVRGNEIGKRVKYWVKPDIENRIKEGSIKAFFNSYIKEIREKEVVIQTQNEEIILENDWVLSLTGYQPNLKFLEQAGVQLGDDEVKKPFYKEETHETNVEGIYVAGVICGGMNTHRLFIENSREHAIKIIDAIAAKTKLQTY